MSEKLEAFIENLSSWPGNEQVFNPWHDVDPVWDKPGSSLVRQEQLKTYLAQRIGKANLILVAEGLSYQGGKFTGIAMTSERIILGGKENISPSSVFAGNPVQTSIKAGGFNEPTASIVWDMMIHSGVDPYTVVLWNAFPWHPHLEKKSLTNRPPTRNELNMIKPLFLQFLDLFDDVRLVAVGLKAQSLLADMGLECKVVRHPARGGANQFRMQMKELLCGKLE
ncbi:MAG: uracil-DNA glycosylase [Proteobacteria bacterium]|nr:uracil-DNA glycosylase [Pseudomonadota bacterium]MDE3208191.1 uracil-DNA glycosylase [Pseudomonadota bacterium]